MSYEIYTFNTSKNEEGVNEVGIYNYEDAENPTFTVIATAKSGAAAKRLAKSLSPNGYATSVKTLCG